MEHQENKKDPIPSPFMAVRRGDSLENPPEQMIEVTQKEFSSNQPIPNVTVTDEEAVNKHPHMDVTPAKLEEIRKLLGVNKILILTQRDDHPHDSPLMAGADHKVSMASHGFLPHEIRNVLEVLRKSLPF